VTGRMSQLICEPLSKALMRQLIISHALSEMIRSYGDRLKFGKIGKRL
jgi:hypothetical protein